MTRPHTIPSTFANEELLLGFFCAKCGEWITDLTRTACPQEHIPSDDAAAPYDWFRER